MQTYFLLRLGLGTLCSLLLFLLFFSLLVALCVLVVADGVLVEPRGLPLAEDVVVAACDVLLRLSLFVLVFSFGVLVALTLELVDVDTSSCVVVEFSSDSPVLLKTVGVFGIDFAASDFAGVA